MPPPATLAVTVTLSTDSIWPSLVGGELHLATSSVSAFRDCPFKIRQPMPRCRWLDAILTLSSYDATSDVKKSPGMKEIGSDYATQCKAQSLAVGVSRTWGVNCRGYSVAVARSACSGIGTLITFLELRSKQEGLQLFSADKHSK